jgi:hypothetical protein
MIGGKEPTSYPGRGPDGEVGGTLVWLAQIGGSSHNQVICQKLAP